MPHDLKVCYGSKNHCWSCDEDEPDQPCFTWCLECKHVYHTEDELRQAWLDHYPEDPEGDFGEPLAKPAEAIPVAEIFFCPLCMHDF
jgi:hypothetical protein